MSQEKPCDNCRFLSTVDCTGDLCYNNNYCDYQRLFGWNKEMSSCDTSLDIDQHKAGAKLDQDKPRTALVLGAFSKALLEVSKVGTFGANKYSDNGWKEVPNGIERYTSAMLRHYFAEQSEFLDPETNLSHAAAVAWNALARLSLILKEQQVEENTENNQTTGETK